MKVDLRPVQLLTDAFPNIRQISDESSWPIYQCIIIAHKRRQCLDIISVLSVWERSRVIWLMLSLWFMKGRLQYLIVCVCVCVMGRRDSWGSVWSRKLIVLHARWAGSGPVNPCVQYRNVLHFISGVLLMFYVMTNPFHWTVNKYWVELKLILCVKKMFYLLNN